MRILFEAKKISFRAQFFDTAPCKKIVEIFPLEAVIKQQNGVLYFVVPLEASLVAPCARAVAPADIVYSLKDKTCCIFLEPVNFGAAASYLVHVGRALTTVDELKILRDNELIRVSLVADNISGQNTQAERVLSQTEIDKLIETLHRQSLS